MVVVPPHARRQAEKRGVSESEIIEVVERGDLIFSEVNGRFGTKRYSKLDFQSRSLVCVWRHNKKGEKEVVTVYWRRKR